MRLKEFYIKSYGPLQDRLCKLAGGFNLLMGNNEHGKTLTIDALVKLLLLKKQKRAAKNFEQINRVERNPEGYAVLLKDDREFRVPAETTLVDLVELTPLEYRNIFMIRNSDLSIRGEDDFYTGITDRLTGLRSQEIERITEKLHERARLTKNERQFVNSEAARHLGKRIKTATTMVSELNALRDDAGKQGYDRLEVELAELEEEKDRLKGELEKLEQARKREGYEKAAAAWQTFKEARERYHKLTGFNDEDRDCWRDRENEVKDLDRQLEENASTLEDYQGRLTEKARLLEAKEKELQVLEKRNGIIDKLVNSELERCMQTSKEIKHSEAKNKRLAPLAYIATALLGISLLSSAINPAWWTVLFTTLFFLLTIACWWPRVMLARQQGNFAKLLEKVNLTLAAYGMQADGLPGILEKINAFKEKYAASKGDAEKISYEQKRLDDKVQELQGSVVPRLLEKKSSAAREIERIKRKTGIENLQDYQKKLLEKHELEKLMGTQKAILKNVVGDSGSKEPEEELQYWEARIKGLQVHEDKATGINYDEKKESELKTRVEELESRRQELKRQLIAFQEQLAALEIKANEMLQPESGYEFLPCRSYMDLETVKEKLQEFIDAWEFQKRAAGTAIDIFEEIKSEEKEKVSELFGEQSAVSANINQITAGHYSCVLFDGTDLWCRHHGEDGVSDLRAAKLSGGAYDQLYFSVRMALGERLFKGEKGFFILDDPFIKSDFERLQRQLEMLKRVAETGWQIIYFSAKKEVEEVLAADISAGTVRYQEVPRLLF